MKVFQIVIIIHAVLDSLEASISKGKSYIELSSSKVFLTRSLYFKRELYLNSSLATGSPDQKPKGVLNQNTYMLNEISLEATISKGISYLEFSLSKANPDQKPPLKDGISLDPALGTGSPTQNSLFLEGSSYLECLYAIRNSSLDDSMSKEIAYLEFSVLKGIPEQKPLLQEGIIFRLLSCNRESYSTQNP